MKYNGSYADKIIASRLSEFPISDSGSNKKAADEGGCGVTGFACNIPVAGRHIFEPSVRMHNRGNGKGGGIAAAGMDPETMGVSREVLDSHYMINIALLDPSCLDELKARRIDPYFEVAKEGMVDHVSDYRSIKGLDYRPPDIWRAFVRVKPSALKDFAAENSLDGMPERFVEDEFVSRNSYKLNKEFYASGSGLRAFVLSHGRDVMIVKIVGYAEHVVKYYMMEDFKAHIWIAHQRYPTRGRVWHPGGAHPFTGLNEALVHNGDFANYHATSDYLRQRGMEPLFMTDTEVSVLLFDLWNRVYGYPLEVIIEALAPTGELDFDLLPPEKRQLYDYVQSAHIHASPDGPWFFIIARNVPEANSLQLLGITDTAMLRPQVFAMYDGDVQIGLVCSEKQAIDATLRSLSEEDSRFSPVADKYWNARGGSSSDGGAFVFNIEKRTDGPFELRCYDKFGAEVQVEKRRPLDLSILGEIIAKPDLKIIGLVDQALNSGGHEVWKLFAEHAKGWGYSEIKAVCDHIVKATAKNTLLLDSAIDGLTLLLDRKIPLGDLKRSALITVVTQALNDIFRGLPSIISGSKVARHSFVDYTTRKALRPPVSTETTLVVDAGDFEPEGEQCDATLLVDAYHMGWKQFIVFNLRGQRFEGCGFGSKTEDVRMDLYGSSGDYVASGIDGMEVQVHGNAQDQIAQIMKRGKLVIHGDTGQCFMYGAKGGEVYVLGNAAGRPLINAAGKPRVVINGAALDFLAESFMAGDPLNGGGFVIVNGLYSDEDGNIHFYDRPYPGSNLFSLASGGSIYIRDPNEAIVDEQLNGGRLTDLTDADWELIYPYLLENEKQFGIPIDTLLTVDGQKKAPSEVYRKVAPVKSAILSKIPDTDDSVWAAKSAAMHG